MSKEMVKIRFRGGEVTSVSRAKLAKNMRSHRLLAIDLGLRPGKPTGHNFMSELNLSSDLLAVALTIFQENLRKSA